MTTTLPPLEVGMVLKAKGVGMVLKAKGIRFRIDFITLGQVHYCRWREGDENGQLGRINVHEFNKAMEQNGAKAEPKGASQ